MPSYDIGQRWVSEPEPELGLGRVIAVEFGRVQLEFPATEEQRMYAADHAPLKRVHYHAGDRVSGKGGAPFVIESIASDGGCFVYSGEGQTIHESDLADSQTFDKPEARLSAGHVDHWRAFDLRLETLE